MINVEWSTHLLCGVATGYLVTGGDWKGAVVGGIASIAPDLDEPKSKFGKIFFPISIPLNQIFGHRTFTHSLLFVLIMSAILFAFLDRGLWLAIITGLIVHILGDMITGKVQILYPIKKSIGIPVTRVGFLLIDRMTRVVLGVVVLIMISKEALQAFV